MKKILFFVTKSVNPYPRLEKEALSLSKNGYNVKVFAWDRERKNTKRLRINENLEIVNFRLKAPYKSFRLVLFLPFWWLFQTFTLLREKYDVVHSFNLDTILPTVIIGKIKNKKIVYDIADFYSSMVNDMINHGFTLRILAKIEIYLAKKCDLVILADDARINELNNEIKNWISIYNCYSKEIKYSDEKPNDKFTIFYGGVLHKIRGLIEIGEAIHGMDDVQLIIAGYGGDETEINRYYTNRKNVKVLGKIKHEEIIDLSSKSDLLFALYDPKIKSHRYSSPNKLFEAMMLGKPIIVSKNTGMDSLIDLEKCGLVVNYGNLSELKDAIIKIKKNKSFAKELGQNGRKAFLTKYTWEIMENKLINAYSNLWSHTK